MDTICSVWPVGFEREMGLLEKMHQTKAYWWQPTWDKEKTSWRLKVAVYGGTEDGLEAV